jgi:putative transposase
MDGCGHSRNKRYIERLMRSVKYKDMYLQGYENLRALKRGLTSFFNFSNQYRYYQNLRYETPEQRYRSFRAKDLAA